MVDEGEGEQHAYRLLLDNAVPLAELRREKTSRIEIRLDAGNVTEDQIRSMRQILSNARGTCDAIVRLAIPGRSETVIPLGDNYKIAPTDELLLSLERLFGERVTTLR